MERIFRPWSGRDGAVRKGNRRAFTLLELLVVVAIAAVLLALIYPAVMGALAKGRDAKCIGNLRSLGQGMALMLQDYGGVFPHSQERSTQKSSARTWGDRGTPQILACALMAEYIGFTKLNGPDATKIACPSAKHPGYRPDTKAYSTSALGYGVNPALCPYIGEPPIDPPFNHARMVGINRPSQIIVLGDAGQQSTSGNAPFFMDWSARFNLLRYLTHGLKPLPSPDTAEQPIEGSAFNKDWMPEPLLPVDRHGGKAHFLFVDGHVQALKQGEIREKNIFWNY